MNLKYRRTNNMLYEYYENDDVTFRGSFKIVDTAQTPDAGSALVRVLEKGRGRGYTPYLAETAASIAATQIYYKLSNLRAGVFRLFFTATFNTGADQRTGIIDFIVRKKVAA